MWHVVWYLMCVACAFLACGVWAHGVCCMCGVQHVVCGMLCVWHVVRVACCVCGSRYV